MFRNVLLVCALFVSQSYGSDTFGKIAFGPNGEITVIATQNQAQMTGALAQKLWDMSCENLSCAHCPRCVGKQTALALEGSQSRNNAEERLAALLSQAQSAINKQ